MRTLADHTDLTLVAVPPEDTLAYVRPPRASDRAASAIAIDRDRVSFHKAFIPRPLPVLRIPFLRWPARRVSAAR
jgi:hypothetical protein